MGEIDRFADSVFEFCEVVDNEKLNILNVKREIIPGTKDDFTPKDLEPSARIISSFLNGSGLHYDQHIETSAGRTSLWRSTARSGAASRSSSYAALRAEKK